MNWGSWLVWGFGATVVLTGLMAGSQGLGFTRMNLPHMIGTMFTADRDRAKLYGFLVHMMNGFIFSLVYIAAFHASGWFNAGFGALVGAAHGLFVLVAAMPIMPGMHPRMASETHGPTVVRGLEPPGFLGRNYGARTPLFAFAAHVIFGAILGAFYTPL